MSSEYFYFLFFLFKIFHPDMRISDTCKSIISKLKL